MRNFTMVSPLVWRSRRFQKLSKNAQLMFMYLLTCEHQTMAGVYRLPPAYGADDLGWSKDEFKTAMEEVASSGLIHRDEETNEVMIEGWFKFSSLKGKPTIKGIENSLDKIESDELYDIGKLKFKEALEEQAEENTQQAHGKIASLSPSQMNGMTPDQLLKRKQENRLAREQYPSKRH